MSGAAHWDGDDLVLALYIQPRASRNEWAGSHGEELKLRITAPPVDGQANAQLQRWLARQFGVGRGQVELLGGDSSRHKRFRIAAPKKLPQGLEIPAR